VFAWHAPGKPLETPDAEVLESGHVASRYTFKHIAADAGIAVCMMLTRRMRIEPDLHLSRNLPSCPRRIERTVSASYGRTMLKPISQRWNFLAPWLLAAAFLLPAQAWAQVALTTQSVNVRAGPSKNFPTVTWLLTGTSVTVVGCTANWRWCDVIAKGKRGWVYTRFLSYRYNDTVATIINGGPNLGLPQTEFVLGPYWDAHYQNQSWFGRKAYWQPATAPR
jgi:uncharacterized protein YraI